MMKKSLTSLALTALLTVAGSLHAQSVRLAVGPESKLWIEGGSNLHDWSCKASSIDAAIEVDESFVKTTTVASTSLKKVQVKVPVRNLKCGNGKMDNNLYKALKADDAPEISYILATFDVVPGTEKDSFTVKAVGALTVAGTEKTVNMDVTAARLPDGGVRAEGALALLMTDFGVKPPTALLGTLRTDNKITVKFSLLVGPQTLSAALAGER
ncbi:MAG TPA: YceI family protein [Gemmatimonadaceae bacterium]|jgi:polyisoprenoid-binding protein YceI|nr:YceI family protein [Gemmatimonadaceae bacterium]